MSFRDRMIRASENAPENIARQKVIDAEAARLEAMKAAMHREVESQLSSWFSAIGIEPTPVNLTRFYYSERELTAQCSAEWTAEGYRFRCDGIQRPSVKKKKISTGPVEITSIKVFIQRWSGWESANSKIQLGDVLRRERDYVPQDFT